MYRMLKLLHRVINKYYYILYIIIYYYFSLLFTYQRHKQRYNSQKTYTPNILREVEMAKGGFVLKIKYPMLFWEIIRAFHGQRMQQTLLE